MAGSFSHIKLNDNEPTAQTARQARGFKSKYQVAEGWDLKYLCCLVLRRPLSRRSIEEYLTLLNINLEIPVWLTGQKFHNQ